MATKNLVPRTNGEGKLGIDSKRWDSLVVNSVSASNITASGNLLVEGDATIQGNLTFGNADTDNISFGAEVSSSIVPNASASYDLGEPLKFWDNVYAQNLYLTGSNSSSIYAAGTKRISVGATTIIAGHVSSSGQLNAQGASSSLGTNVSAVPGLTVQGHISASGTVYADSFESVTGGSTLDFSDSVNVTGDITASGNISASGNLEIAGTADIDGDVVISGSLDVGHEETSPTITLRNIDNSSGWFLTTKAGVSSTWTPQTPATTHLGIKTSTPTVDLQVEGTISASGHLHLIDSASFGTNFTSSAQVTVQGDVSASGKYFEGLNHLVNASATASLITTNAITQSILVENASTASILVRNSITASNLVRNSATASLTVPNSTKFGSKAGTVDTHIFSGSVSIHQTGSTTALFITGSPLFVDGMISASGTITSSGRIHSMTVTASNMRTDASMVVGTNIVHADDVDTKIAFADDDITITVGNEQMLKFTEDGSQDIITVGDGGDIDFHVKAGGSNTLFAQGSSQNIGIGTATPTKKLEVAGDISASGNLYLGNSAGVVSQDLGSATTVTSNGVKGELRLTAAAAIPASGSSTEFTFANSSIEPLDIVLIQNITSGSAGAVALNSATGSFITTYGVESGKCRFRIHASGHAVNNDGVSDNAQISCSYRIIK